MHQIHLVETETRRDIEKLLEVPALAEINDIPNLIGLPFIDSKINGGNVGGSIVEGTIRFLNHHGIILPLTIAIDLKRISLGFHRFTGEDAHRSVTFAGQIGRFQFFDQGRKGVIVGTFAHPVIKGDTKAIIHCIESLSGKLETTGPDRGVLGIPLLKLHQLGTAFIFDRLVFLRGIGSRAIQSQQFLQGSFFELGFINALFPSPGNHAKLRSPITNMVILDYFVTESGRNS